MTPHVEFAREQVGEESLGQVFLQLQLHAAVILAEPQPMTPGSTNGATVRMAPTREAPALGGISHRPFGLLHCRENRLRVREQFVPGVGEHHLPAEPVEQPPPDAVVLAFQRMICSLSVGCVTFSRSAAR